jgi:hypothetical protein
MIKGFLLYLYLTDTPAFTESISGLVAKSIVAIDWPRVRFPADANTF